LSGLLKVLGLLAFMILGMAVVPSHVSARISFPHDGARLEYAITDMSNSSFGSIAAVANDSYTFSKLGDSWNVTEILVGRIACSPTAATLSVKYGTTSDIFGQKASVSSSPNIFIQASYIINDRIIVSTSIGPKAPASYYATCTFREGNKISIAGGTVALYASTFKYYVFTYIDPTGVTQGTSVPVSIVTATISGTQPIQALGKSRTALVGTISGFVSATMYWEISSGILLLEKSTSTLQTEQMQLIQNPDLAD
jgi:hypothetical protein